MTTPGSRPVGGPVVVGEPAADRLMRSLDYRLHPEARRLTRDEVAVVLHALADHTAIVQALSYRRAGAGYYPEATSVGRWLHDTADQLTSSAPLTKARAEDAAFGSAEAAWNEEADRA